MHPCPHFDDQRSIPFPGSDRSVAVRTQILLANEYNQRPIQCNAYLVCGSLLTLWGLWVVGYFMQLLTKYKFGQTLLLKVLQTCKIPAKTCTSDISFIAWMKIRIHDVVLNFYSFRDCSHSVWAAIKKLRWKTRALRWKRRQLSNFTAKVGRIKPWTNTERLPKRFLNLPTRPCWLR